MSAKYSLADYTSALLNLLPRGRAWNKDPNSDMGKLMSALAKKYESIDFDANDLITDAFPASTVNLLPEWESSLGLPDACFSATSPTITDRQSSVVAALTTIGGQNQQRYIDLAAKFGYQVTITQFAPSRFGRPFGNTFGGADWAFTWQVNAPSYTINSQKFGQSFGDPFATFNNSALGCLINRAAPAHTIVLYKYGAI